MAHDRKQKFAGIFGSAAATDNMALETGVYRKHDHNKTPRELIRFALQPKKAKRIGATSFNTCRISSDAKTRLDPIWHQMQQIQ
jgi:hypothetical protein